MRDESNFARVIAADVALDPPVNGNTNMQDAIAATDQAAWYLPDLPTTDPGVVDQVWSNMGVLTLSNG